MKGIDYLRGVITKGIGGFYYVRAEDSSLYECKARGIFRKDKIIPRVGDYVIFDKDKKVIEEILTRKNTFKRPSVSNIDQAFIITSVAAYYGYFVKGGALEVGKASTNSVVSSSILILLMDIILTRLMM